MNPNDSPTNKVTVGVLVGAIISLAVEVASIYGFEMNATVQANITTIIYFTVQYLVPDAKISNA